MSMIVTFRHIYKSIFKNTTGRSLTRNIKYNNSPRHIYKSIFKRKQNYLNTHKIVVATISYHSRDSDSPATCTQHF